MPNEPQQVPGKPREPGEPQAKGDPQVPGKPNDELRRRAGKFLRDLVVIFVVALVISVGIKTFLARSFYIPSVSMSSTLVPNDRVIVNQLVPDPIALNRGDVVVFSDPDNWLDLPEPESEPTNGFATAASAVNAALRFVGLTADNDDHLIKRIIGLPGDSVECCTDSGKLTVNGTPIDEPYAVIPAGQFRGRPRAVRRHRTRRAYLGDGRQPIQLGRLGLSPQRPLGRICPDR
jgi:signal peptidase I